MSTVTQKGKGETLATCRLSSAAEERPGWAAELPTPLPEVAVTAARDSLLRCPCQERRALLHRHWPEERIQIVLALVEKGFSHRHSDAKEGLRVAQLAYQCAYRYLCLPATMRPLGRQLRAAALGFLANAYRIQGNHTEAERCWKQIHEWETKGYLPPVLLARLLNLEASLARDRRHFQRVESLLSRSLDLLTPAEDGQERGRVLLKLAMAYEDAGAYGAALRQLLLAAAAIGEGRVTAADGLIMLHYMVYLVAELGQPARAARLFCQQAWLYTKVGEPLIQLRGRALLGRLLRELGDPAAAVPHLDAVRTAFIAREQFYEASLIGLELALAHAQRHDYLKVFQLAREMYPVFQSRSIPREASMVLVEFGHAAENYRVEAKDILKAMAQLRELRRAEGPGAILR